MALNTVTLTWDLTDLVQSGLSAIFSIEPDAVLADATDGLDVLEVARSVTFTGGTGQLAGIVANDNANILPAGTAYVITVVQGGVTLLSQTSVIAFANGAVQKLSSLVAASVAPALVSSLPLPTGTATAGKVPVASGTGEVSAWGTLSGQFLRPPSQYAPSTQAVLSTTSATMAAVSSANVNTGAFTAPPSGEVLVSVSGMVMQISADADEAAFGLCAHGTVTPMAGDVSSFRFSVSQAGADSSFPAGMQFLVSGLAAGNSYNFDLMWAVAGAATLTAYPCETTSVTPPFSNATLGQPIIMTVQGV